MAVEVESWAADSGACSSTASPTASSPRAPTSPWLSIDGVVYRPQVADAERPARERTHDLTGSLAAPMPATVRAINVAAGDRV